MQITPNNGYEQVERDKKHLRVDCLVVKLKVTQPVVRDLVLQDILHSQRGVVVEDEGH